MLVALLSAIFGAAVASASHLVQMNVVNVMWHLANTAAILYMSHLVDTYNDLKRGEYEAGYRTRQGDSGTHPLNSTGYKFGTIVCLLLALVCTLTLTYLTGPIYLGIAVFGIALALSYGSGLDYVLFFGDMAWETGVIFVLLGGYYVQTVSLEPPAIMLALLVLVPLFGIKQLDAIPDIEPDRKAGKNTIPAKVGETWAYVISYVLILAGLTMMGFVFLSGMMPSQLIYGVIAAGGLTIISIPFGARKGIYLVFLGIALLLLWSIWVVYPPIFPFNISLALFF